MCVRFFKDKRGGALAEFALMLVAMVPLVFGTVEVSRMLICKQTVSQAAAMGARFAATHGDTADVRQWIDAQLDTARLTAEQVSISASAWCWGETVAVTVTVPFTVSIPMVGENARQLAASAFALVERDMDPGCPSY